MFTVLILICSVTLAPQDCKRHSALDVIQGPQVANELMCGMHGQAFIAETALGTGLGPDEYIKIVCTRTAIMETVG
jgi:hypothetical protein